MQRKLNIHEAEWLQLLLQKVVLTVFIRSALLGELWDALNMILHEIVKCDILSNMFMSTSNPQTNLLLT